MMDQAFLVAMLGPALTEQVATSAMPDAPVTPDADRRPRRSRRRPRHQPRRRALTEL